MPASHEYKYVVKIHCLGDKVMWCPQRLGEKGNVCNSEEVLYVLTAAQIAAYQNVATNPDEIKKFLESLNSSNKGKGVVPECKIYKCRRILEGDVISQEKIEDDRSLG